MSKTTFGGGCPISLDLLQCFLRRMSLEKICVASWNRVVQDMEDLKASVKDFGSAEANDLAHWDLNFWSERLRESKYNIDEISWISGTCSLQLKDAIMQRDGIVRTPVSPSPINGMPSTATRGSTYLNSWPSSPRWLVRGLSSMAPRTRKSGKAVLVSRVGWRPEPLVHGDGRWRRRPQAEMGRGEDVMKRGGRGRWQAHGEAPAGADLVVGGKTATPSSTQAAILLQHSSGKYALIFCSTRKGAQEAA